MGAGTLLKETEFEQLYYNLGLHVTRDCRESNRPQHQLTWR